MTKRPDFASDLMDVQRDVGQSVSSILSAVKEQSAKRETPATETSATIDLPRKTPSTQGRETRASSPRKPSPTRHEATGLGLVNVTTRLRLQTKELLAESALRQRLSKMAPDTEQAIIEEALQQWFKRAGYGLRQASPQESPANEPTSPE